MTEDRRPPELSTYIKHAIDMRRLIRANRYDSRIRSGVENYYFCDANVAIDLATMTNLARATNLFAITSDERLEKFFEFNLAEELGPEATAVVVGAFETATYIASGHLPSQAQPRLFLTDDHRKEFDQFRVYGLGELNAVRRQAEDKIDPVSITSQKPIDIVRELFTKIDDAALQNLLIKAGVVDRLSKLMRSGRLATENVVTGAAIRYDEDLANDLTKRIADASPKTEVNAQRDGVSLAKLIALQDGWRTAGANKRCILITRDGAIHHAYRSYYFSTDIGKSEDADEWYLLREPAQYAPVLNFRNLQASKASGPRKGLAYEQVFRDLGDSALALLAAQRVLVDHEIEEFREHSDFRDNVRNYAMLLPPKGSPETHEAAGDLRELWLEAMLASIAFNVHAADAGDVLSELASWIKQPRNIKELFADVEKVSDRAAHDHAAFALQTVRETHTRPAASAAKRALVILMRREKVQEDGELDFRGNFDDYRRAAIECLESDAWMAALFFARRGKYIAARDSVGLQRDLDANYLFSVSCRLALSRMSDLDEALSACMRSIRLARQETNAGYGVRARSELYSVQTTQWLYMQTAHEPWAMAIRPVHLERTTFYREHAADRHVQEIKRLRSALEREAGLIDHLPNSVWRAAAERQVRLNLFIVRWLCCVAENGVSKCYEGVAEALADLDDYLDNDDVEPPIFIDMLRHLASRFVDPSSAADAQVDQDLDQIRGAEKALPIISTDRLLVEFLFRSIETGRAR